MFAAPYAVRVPKVLGVVPVGFYEWITAFSNTFNFHETQPQVVAPRNTFRPRLFQYQHDPLVETFSQNIASDSPIPQGFRDWIDGFSVTGASSDFCSSYRITIPETKIVELPRVFIEVTDDVLLVG